MELLRHSALHLGKHTVIIESILSVQSGQTAFSLLLMTQQKDHFIHQRHLLNFELFVQWVFTVNRNHQEVGDDFQDNFSFVVRENSRTRRN